jgi:hypothetical protein
MLFGALERQLCGQEFVTTGQVLYCRSSGARAIHWGYAIFAYMGLSVRLIGYTMFVALAMF